jgi:hypothetical protein
MVMARCSSTAEVPRNALYDHVVLEIIRGRALTGYGVTFRHIVIGAVSIMASIADSITSLSSNWS